MNFSLWGYIAINLIINIMLVLAPNITLNSIEEGAGHFFYL